MMKTSTRHPARGLGCALGICILLASGTGCVVSMEAEWQLADGTVFVASSGVLGSTGVTVEFRPTATPHGTRYDVRLRNRTGTEYTQAALRVRLPRGRSDGAAAIEGLSVPVPCELHQWWEAGPLDGSEYGFAYEIRGNGATLRRIGPSATEGEWGGRASGVVRIDGTTYVVPELWERQPRRISVSPSSIVLTLFEGSEPLRPGEDVWDRFAILRGPSLSDSAAVSEAEGLSELSGPQRQQLRQRFGIAPEGLSGIDPDAEGWLRKYDRWQGTAWQKSYADENPAREWSGEADSRRTTLFTLFAKGFFYPIASPGTYAWRDYGDIQWADDKSNLHYDWLRAALKHYLRTGNEDALRWGTAAMRHAVAVDHLWESPSAPARHDLQNLAGLARYEKGDHGGGDFVARPTHTWVEGLFLAYALTGEEWAREAAVDVAEADWRMWGGDQAVATWDGAYGETRMLGWPLYALVVALRETGTEKYWIKAKELMEQIYQQEQRSGGKGYVTNAYTDVGNLNNAQSLMNAYAIPGMTAFADEALRRGEWRDRYGALMQRWAAWLTTPVPAGTYFPDGSYFTPPDPAVTYGSFAYVFCPPGLACSLPTSTFGEVAYSIMVSDLCAWLVVHDPGGGNPTTGRSWNELARTLFRDAVAHGPQSAGIVGFLTDNYPTTETKVMGWMQLFQDRAAMWLGGA